MANNDSLIVKSTVGTTVNSKSITDINPNATDAELSAFATALYGLTTNNIASVTKVTKRDIIADGLYPVSVAGTVEGTAFTKVDDTHYTCDITKLKAAADWTTEYISLKFTANSQRIEPAFKTSGISIGFVEGDGEYGMPFVNVASNISSTPPQTDDHWEISLHAPAVATLYDGAVVKVTFNAGQVNNFYFSDTVITVTCVSGV